MGVSKIKAVSSRLWRNELDFNCTDQRSSKVEECFYKAQLVNVIEHRSKEKTSLKCDRAGLWWVVISLAYYTTKSINLPPHSFAPLLPPQQAHTRSGIFSTSPYLWDGAHNSLSAGWGCWASFILIQTGERWREWEKSVSHPVLPLCHSVYVLPHHLTILHLCFCSLPLIANLSIYLSIWISWSKNFHVISVNSNAVTMNSVSKWAAHS